MLRRRLNATQTNLIRYLLVGASVNGVGYLAYLLLTAVGLTPRLTVTVLLPVSLWAAFRLHGRVTFSASERQSTAGIRFLAVSLVGYALNLAILTALVDGAEVPHQVAQLVSVALIALVMFRLMRRFVFPEPIGAPRRDE
jgi:putative flippase GtrA